MPLGRGALIDALRTSPAARPAALAAALAGIALLHPTWSGLDVYAAVAPRVDWWILLHILLVVVFPALAWSLAHRSSLRNPTATLERLGWVAFTIANLAFLAVEGLGTGVLIKLQPAATAEATVNALWASPLMAVLANLTGALWATTLALRAVATIPSTPPQPATPPSPPFQLDKPAAIGAALTVVVLLASALVPAIPAATSRLVATATAALILYQRGTPALPFALLLFAAILPQHVGPVATLGALSLAAALIMKSKLKKQLAHD